MKSLFIVLGIYALFGALAAVIALALGGAWRASLLSAIFAPIAFAYLAGKLVAHSVILYLDEKTKR